LRGAAEAEVNEWATRVKEHRIWGLMSELGPTIDSAVHLDGGEPSALEALERLRTVLAFCGRRLGAADPQLVLPGPLDQMAASFVVQKSEVDSFRGNLSPAHLVTANNQADTVLASLATIPGECSPEELIALMQAISSYRSDLEDRERSSSAARKQSKAEIAELTSALEAFKVQTLATTTDLKTQIESERQKLSTVAAEQQKSFADAQTLRANTYNDTLLKIQENLAKTLTDQQGQFSGAQENRSREFTSAQTDAQKRFGDLIADHSKKLADQDAEFTKRREVFLASAEKQLTDLNLSFEVRAEHILDEVKKHRDEVQKLVGVIGNLGVTSGYQKTANSSRISMWIWQGLAVAGMIVVILFAFKAFLPTLQGDFHWATFAGRVFLTITVGVFAAYAASQADRFFQMEKYNRKLSLELAAIDPFIALLPIDEQQKFKLEIGRRSFAQDDPVAVSSVRSPATTLDVLASKEGQQLLQILLDNAQKLVKRP
jgi:hypothetical protein